jgi:16S rRNA (cytidine1402-2'-O)-methyltransferase
LYESPFRLLKTLEELSSVLGPEREVSVSREISKLHEETVRGTLAYVCDWFRDHTPRGEIVIVLKGKGKENEVG